MSNFAIKIKWKRNNSFAFCFMLLFLWVLMAYNTSSADIDYYSNMFARIRSGITYYAVEGGFYYLCKVAVSLGMDYPVFLKIYAGVALLLIASSILRYTKKPWTVLLFYFCYPFILDIAQVRHFMAVAIFIYAIRYLEKFDKKNLIIYCFFVGLATTQQILAFSFFLFLLVYLADNKKVVKISVVFMVAMFIGQRLLLHTWIYRSILSLRDKEINYTQGISISMFLQYALFYAVLLGFCIYLNKVKRNENDILFKIAMLSAVFIPLLLIDFQFTRFFRSSIMLVYIYISNGISRMRYQRDRLIYGSLFGAFMIVVFLSLFGPTSGYFETMTRPIFQENGLIGFVFGS